MKRTISAFIILASVFVFLGCEKNTQRLIDTSVPEGKALIKINYAMPFAVNNSVQLKVNGTRVSSLLTYDTPFPGGGLNTGGGSYPDYLAVSPGSNVITISRPNVGTANDSILLFTGTVNLEANKNVTLHVTDTGANANIVMIADNINFIDSGFSRYTFVNLMPNVTALDLYYGTSTTPVATNIPYKGKSPEFTLVAGSGGSWAIRPAGALPTSTALATYANTIPNQRSMTVFSRGYSGAASPRNPAVSLIYNR
jgi:hypothetical protein